MIYANLNRLGQQFEYPVVIFKLLQDLQKMDLHALPLGQTIHGDEGIYFNIFEVSSIEEADDKRISECHDEYVDVQVSLNGHEVYGFAPRHEKNILLEDRLDSEDAFLFQGLYGEVSILANPSDVFIFFPNDVHRVYYQNSQVPKSKRFVAKVPVKLLER